MTERRECLNCNYKLVLSKQSDGRFCSPDCKEMYEALKALEMRYMKDVA